jgi:4a-hydroxytetrahydrobiopterin dehydratase
MHKLSESERNSLLPTLNGWKYDNKSDSISKSFKFASFPHALGFIVTLGVEAQALNHHPELFNVYDRVDITWRTHDCQGLSIKDVDMAKKCDEIYKP